MNAVFSWASRLHQYRQRTKLLIHDPNCWRLRWTSLIRIHSWLSAGEADLATVRVRDPLTDLNMLAEPVVLENFGCQPGAGVSGCRSVCAEVLFTPVARGTSPVSGETAVDYMAKFQPPFEWCSGGEIAAANLCSAPRSTVCRAVTRAECRHPCRARFPANLAPTYHHRAQTPRHCCSTAGLGNCQ